MRPVLSPPVLHSFPCVLVAAAVRGGRVWCGARASTLAEHSSRRSTPVPRAPPPPVCVSVRSTAPTMGAAAAASTGSFLGLTFSDCVGGGALRPHGDIFGDGGGGVGTRSRCFLQKILGGVQTRIPDVTADHTTRHTCCPCGCLLSRLDHEPGAVIRCSRVALSACQRRRILLKGTNYCSVSRTQQASPRLSRRTC